MKNKLQILPTFLVVAAIAFSACGAGSTESASAPETSEAADAVGQSGVKDDVSQKDVVKVAAGSADHTTLVTAVTKAELVDVLSNAGPFTVFAPTNAAFNALPAGTVDDLLKAENKEKLQDILQYHVAVAVYKEDMLSDGQTISMANGGSIRISKKDGKIMINDKATVLGAVPASNGLVYVIDQVLTQ